MKSWLFLAWNETCDLLTQLDIKFELKYDLFLDVYFVEKDDFNGHHLVKKKSFGVACRQIKKLKQWTWIKFVHNRVPITK